MLTVEGGRFSTLSRMRSLRPADWDRQTPCAGWQVRHLAAHLAETTRRLAGNFLPIVVGRTYPAPTTEEPGDERSDIPPDAIIAHATLGRNQFASITALLSPDDAGTSLGDPAPKRPARTVARVMTVAALEFGLHITPATPAEPVSAAAAPPPQPRQKPTPPPKPPDEWGDYEPSFPQRLRGLRCGGRNPVGWVREPMHPLSGTEHGSAVPSQDKGRNWG